MAELVARIPEENLRVSRAEFGAVWSMVERWAGQPGPDNDFLIGVLRTCRWLADQPVWSRVMSRAEMPLAPVTFREHAAMPETPVQRSAVFALPGLVGGAAVVVPVGELA